ncbi:hypothetical protein CRE_18337, partial [Caenorhabditis remanei]
MARQSHGTPSRSSERSGYALLFVCFKTILVYIYSCRKQTSHFQVVHDKKKRSKRDKKNSSVKSKKSSGSNDSGFKKIFDHGLYNSHYVEYHVLLKNGKKIKAVEFDFKGNEQMLADYKFKITNQEDKPGEEYLVEKIVAHRFVKKSNKLLFLVMWRGFPNPVSHTEMWESELEDCKDLVDQYKDSHDMTPPKKPAKNKYAKKARSRKSKIQLLDEKKIMMIKKAEQPKPTNPEELGRPS